MDARYDDSGQLTTLYLRGGVEMRQGDRRALAQNADYDARTRELVLTGEPRLFDRGDVLVGERIGLALDSHEVRVERAHGRLRPEAHQDEARAGVKR
jgi:lipopolysaccharide export system protein LptA